MTKEQEKAIKVLEQYKYECIEEYKVELDDKKYIDEQHTSYLHQQIEAVQIVLSMLKENSAEIQQKNIELAEKNAEIEKKDRIINEIQKELKNHIAFENRLKRENREPDLFNQGRFYVANNINNILKGKSKEC